jgi:hypothetical protein
MSVPPVLGKEGIWSLVFGQHRFCDGVFLFSFPILVLCTILTIMPHLFVAGYRKHLAVEFAGVSMQEGSGANYLC